MALPKAVILAAGRGSRMESQTANKPKCLVELAGRSLLDWQCTALRENGLTDILVIRGYKAECLQGDYETADNPRWQDSNMVVTLMTAERRLAQNPCVISYADIVYHPSHVALLIRTEGDIVITYDTSWETLWSQRFLNPLDDAETFKTEQGRLQEIGRKTTRIEDVNGQYMGLLKFTPTGWQQIKDTVSELPQASLDRLDMTGLISKLLERDIMINTVPITGKWCEADSGDDLKLYESLISEAEVSGQSWAHDWRW